MRYLLDTDTCIYIMKHKPAGTLKRFEQTRAGDVGMSVITYLELVYGASKSRHVEANLARIEQLSGLIPVLPLDSRVATHYGNLRTQLERSGSRIIGAHDLLIAAHALGLGLIVVTNNVREFGRVRGLRIENWAE
jgi:tRNA(fMet)-specific endonuclease VapC